MDWKRGNQLSSYLRSSLWIVPIGAVVLEQIFALPMRMLDAGLGWSWLGLGVEGARALCNAVINLTLTFTVFTFGSLLISIQVASGQYTPRIIATTLLCNNVVRYTVGLFVFSFVFAIQTVNRVEIAVPQLLVFLTGLLGFACLAAFLFLIDYAARLLRPVSLVQNVGEAGLKVIDSIYPDNIDRTGNKSLSKVTLTAPKRTILHQRRSAIVLAVNTPKLLNEAIKTKGIVELAPQVGNFVGVGEPLVLLHETDVEEQNWPGHTEWIGDRVANCGIVVAERCDRSL